MFRFALASSPDAAAAAGQAAATVWALGYPFACRSTTHLGLHPFPSPARCSRSRRLVLRRGPYLPAPSSPASPVLTPPAAGRRHARGSRPSRSPAGGSVGPRRRAWDVSLQFPFAVMRWGGALLLLLVAVFAALAVAEDTTHTLPAETNGGSSGAHSGVEKSEQHDDTNPNKEHVSHEDGARNDTSGNNNMGNSTEGTDIRRNDVVQQPEDKDKNTTKSSQARDFLQDPLINDCDPSHRCVIENKKFIACLKVSGEDSSALSLLMDNKGINPLDVSITAPDYVTLAEGAVHVEANDHRETQVSVSSDAANNTAIVLKIAEENCTIDIHNAITRETGRVIRMPLTSTYTLVIGFTFLLFVVVGVCIKLRRTRKQDGSPAYQKLDTTELPVSVGGKKELDQSDKWDDNWGDDWDDEEAPVTPSKPMPTPSSKGLAPRRSTKDGWKD